ncbi:MAG TPA: integrin alpha, partial [Planctomycetota bacterium]|nr:integrin alpha [Planctomycetota bacterium]
MSRSLLAAGPCILALLAGLAGAQTKTAELVGSLTMESLGSAVVLLGDVDGDGLPDWAAGAPFHNNVTTIPGRVYVCKGSTAAAIRVLNGAIGGDDFGYALADAGDVDGDGVRDLLVGAPDFPQSSGHDSGTPGSVYLFSGASGAQLLHVTGDNPNDMFGTAVAGLDDVDGDSIEDFAVGAVGYDGAAANGGLVRLISGASGATIWSAAEAQVDAGFGARLARIGDLDGDGFADLIVGAPRFDGPTVDAGAAFVLSGAS